jgi:hypothetical protein
VPDDEHWWLKLLPADAATVFRGLPPDDRLAQTRHDEEIE